MWEDCGEGTRWSMRVSSTIATLRGDDPLPKEGVYTVMID